MRIENGNLNGVTNSGAFEGVQPSGSERLVGSTPADASSFDSVQLSAASSLVVLARSVSSMDRQSRIGNLAAEVQTGSYRVDAQQVSQAIVEGTN